MIIGIANAAKAHKKEGYKKLIGTKLIKKYCHQIPLIIWPR
jgi:hypothetical protein